MKKTFDESLVDTAKISMSVIDIDDITDKTTEEFESLRREQQGCHNELTHRQDFPFGKYTKKTVLAKGQNSFSVPNGQVQNIYFGVTPLTYTNSALSFDAKQGRPLYYSVKNNPDKIVVYPIPDEQTELIIEYYDDRFVVDKNGDFQWEISTDSTLRMPERVQHLYFDALEYFLLADLKKSRIVVQT